MWEEMKGDNIEQTLRMVRDEERDFLAKTLQ
jgi:hypothetical protein